MRIKSSDSRLHAAMVGGRFMKKQDLERGIKESTQFGGEDRRHFLVRKEASC